jgi:TonB family protein
MVRQIVARHSSLPPTITSEDIQCTVLVTIARDGSLLDATINRSTGSRDLDSSTLAMVRQSAPYAPLPAQIQGDWHTFSLTFTYKTRK